MGKANTKKKILNAAADCFARKGFHVTTTDEIARIAGVAKGSVYYNFKSKEALLCAVIEWGLTIIEEETEKLLASDLPDRETLREILVLYTDLILDYPDLAAVVFTSRPGLLSSEWSYKIEQLTDRAVSRVASLMEEGARWGFLRKTDYSLAAAGLFGMLWNSCHYFAREEGRKREGIYRMLFETVLNGLAKDEGK